MVSRTDWHFFFNCPERTSCKEGYRQAPGWCTMSPTPPKQHLQPGLSGASPAEQWAYQSRAGPRPCPDSTHPSWLEEVPLALHTVLDVDQLLQVFLWAGTGDGHPSTPLASAVYPLQGDIASTTEEENRAQKGPAQIQALRWQAAWGSQPGISQR